MLGCVLRIASVAVLLAIVVVVPSSAAQIGSGKIAYTIGVFDNPREGDGLYTVNADGSARTLLKPGNAFSSARWSPDGSRVAFTDHYWDGSRRRYRLLVIDGDGSNERLLAAGIGSVALSRQPWAPDGSRIAWAETDELGSFQYTDLYTAEATGANVRQLTFDHGGKGPPAWSPSGPTLVYSHYNGRWALFVVGADGSGPTQITPYDWDDNPTWSPNGDWIVFTRHYVVHVVHPDGTGLRQVQSADGVVLWPPTWSPDGSKIAYEWIRQTGRYTYTGGMEIVDADGRNPKLVSGSSPVWSPDGDRILFSGTRGLTTMNTDGTCQVLVNGDYAPGISSWQPVPGGPSGQMRCHAISVGVGAGTRNPAAVLINAVVANEGTEPLTNVTLVATAPNNVSPSLARFQGQGCSVRRQRVTCRLSRLEPGARNSFSLRFDARRVWLGPGGNGAGFRIRLKANASEQLLRTQRESDEFVFAIARCTDRDRGGGTIHGTALADKICGRRGADHIFPGEGNDVVKAGDGNDAIFAVDGRHYSDQISCGRGRDRVIADRRDRVSPDCEIVRRR